MIDAGILEDILSHIHNWFVVSATDVKGCEIIGKALPASVSDGLLDGQWYRIEGSVLNDGLHLYRTSYPQGESSDLTDETFDVEVKDTAEVSVDFSELGIDKKAKVRDLWEGKDLGTFEGSFSRVLKCHDAGIYRITPVN